MKIKRVILTNFRAFKNVQTIEFDDFNCIIGKNDVGKSSILVALDWFFGNRKLSDNDINIDNIVKDDNGLVVGGDEMSVEVQFEVPINEEIPNFISDENKFFYHNDFIDNNLLRIKKYLLHSSSYQFDSEYEVKKTGYFVWTKHYNCLGNKPLSLLTIEELKTEVSKLGKDFEIIKADIQTEINQQKQQFANDNATLVGLQIEELNIDNKTYKVLCNEFSTHHYNDIKWDYDNIGNNVMEFYFKSHSRFPKYKFFNAESSLREYIKLLFVGSNTQETQTKINELKVNVAQLISNKVFPKEPAESFSFSDSYEYLADSILLSDKGIPLSNRGDGFQLKIKNAVFRLLSEQEELSEQPMIFVFEEPETHLHPSAQIEMYETIKDLSKNKLYQVIITSHSPYIVNALSEKKTEIVVVKRENNETTAKNVKLSSSRILNYLSFSEISYIAFDVASIDYHQELYGKIEIDWDGESNGSKIDGIIGDGKICQYQCTNRNEQFEVLANNLVSMYSPKIQSINNLVLKNNTFVSPDKGPALHSICHCVRNSIDHPCNDNEQWKQINVVELSIKILIELNNCFLDIEQKFIKKIECLSKTELDSKWENLKLFVNNGSSMVEEEHTLLYWLSYIYKEHKAVYKYDSKSKIYKRFNSHKKLLDSLDRQI